METVIRVCYVRWRDATHFRREAHEGWFNRDEIAEFIEQAEPLDRKTVGWLVHHDADKLTLAGTVNGVFASDVLVIPRTLVTDFRVLDDPPDDPESGPVPVIVLPDSPGSLPVNAATTKGDATRFTAKFRVKRAAHDGA